MEQQTLTTRQKCCAWVVVLIFTVVVPGVFFAMIPTISPAVGWPVIGWSIIVGVGVAVFGFFPEHFHRWIRGWRLAVVVCGLLVCAAGSGWFYCVNSHPASEGLPNAESIALPTEGYWPPLSNEQAETLRRALRPVPPATIYIRCNDERCRPLALSFRKVFRDLGWDASTQEIMDDMRDGLSIAPHGEVTIAIANAIESATQLTVASAPVSPDSAIHLFIGEKPD